VRQRYQDGQQPQLNYLVLDFRRVTGIDSSAIMGFQKLRHIALTNNFKILFTQLPEATQHHFVDEGVDQPDDHIHAFPDLDHALEWCENALLDVSGVTQARVSVMLEGQLEEQGFDVKLVKPLRQYLERRVLDKGEYLMQQGGDATDLFFIEIGQVSVVLELPDKQTVRLRTMQMGTVIGEVGFYLKQKRSASIVADTKAVAYRLSQEALARMKEEQPQLAIALDEMMIRIVAERLARNNRTIEAYSR
jgi:sulfate permease, SulP family